MDQREIRPEEDNILDAPQIVAGMLSSCYTGEMIRLLLEPRVGWRGGTLVGFFAGLSVGRIVMEVVRVLENQRAYAKSTAVPTEEYSLA